MHSARCHLLLALDVLLNISPYSLPSLPTVSPCLPLAPSGHGLPNLPAAASRLVDH